MEIVILKLYADTQDFRSICLFGTSLLLGLVANLQQNYNLKGNCPWSKYGQKDPTFC